MEARLRLAQQRYTFGLGEVVSSQGGPDRKFTIGIKISAVATPNLPRLHRRRVGLRKGTATKDNISASDAKTQYALAGVDKFVVLKTGERPAPGDVSGVTNRLAGGTTGREIGEGGQEQQ